MNTRRKLTALAAATMLASCSRNQETGRASVDAVTDDPSNYIGRTVTVRGEVDKLQNDRRVFSVEDHDWVFPEELLVVTPRPASEMMSAAGLDSLREGEEIQVTGVIRRLVMTELERDYDFDLERDFELEFRERPILVAGAIVFSSGQKVESGRSGATVPPPPDSALLERDLPHTPVGDTTGDMSREAPPGSAAATGAPVTNILLIIPVPGPRDLIGKPVQLEDIPVRSRVGERGYWVGPSHSQQVFVRLNDKASATVQPGENATLWGTLQPLPAREDMTAQWGLAPNAAGILARNEALYIKADSIKASGN